MGKLHLNVGGVLGALLAMATAYIGVSMIVAGTDQSLPVPIGIAGCIGGILGNACWAAVRESAIGRFIRRRVTGIVEVPESDDESSLFDADKTARRREIAERWKQGRRLEDDQRPNPR